MEIPEVVANLHRWCPHRAHDFDGISGHLRVYTFCCSLVRDIQEGQAKLDTAWLFSPS